MKAQFRSVAWLCAVTSLTAATAAFGQAATRKLPPVRITPEIIQQAAAATEPAKDVPDKPGALLGKELQAPEIFRQPTQNLEHIPNGCAKNSGSLCYDYRSGRAVYKPMRKLLPELPGMTPHNLSIHRDKIVAQYTFK